MSLCVRLCLLVTHPTHLFIVMSDAILPGCRFLFLDARPELTLGDLWLSLGFISWLVGFLGFSLWGPCTLFWLILQIKIRVKRRPLQRIQNTAARLVIRTKKSEHITPVLQSLNWLPIHQCICFKVLLLVYKIYHKLAPAYLQDLVSFRSTSISSSTRQLRSAATAHLQLCPGPRTITRYGDRAFSSIAPKLWNNLPVDIRSAPTLDLFKTMLKTHLYNHSYCNV